MSNSLRQIAAAFCHLLVLCCIATAQQVEESRPAVYYLPDKQGNLQPVLDFKYQDFVELYKLKNQLPRRDEPPAYSVQRMTATGVARDGYAELSIQFEVVVRDDNWVRVPLRLDQGLLRGEVKYKGSGQQIVHYDRDGEGYVCWLRGKSDTQHEITLTMLVPLVALGDQTRLKLLVPHAAASELKLKVPVADAVGTVSEGAALLSSGSADAGATEFTVAGLVGDFQLAWRKPNPHAANVPVVLEATGTILTRLDARSITDDATLSVRSDGAEFDRFTVRLPPGAEDATESREGYVVTAVANPKENQRRLVTVQLAKKTVGPIDVRLACRRNYDPLQSPSWCELAGFDVMEAARQSGVVAVAAPGDWQVLWGASRDVRATDLLPNAVQKADVVAGFEYAAQPYSLTARLSPRTAHLSVDPQYVVLVDRNTVRLEGKLTYTIRGAKDATLEMALPGWELDSVGPENLVVAGGVTVHGEQMAVPLTRPIAGTLELQVRAHRSIDAEAKSLRFALPRLQANSIGPASVAVVPADNVELTPACRAMHGLTRLQAGTLRGQERLPDRQQDPLCYRVADGAAVFAADFQVHAQHIAVDVDSQATVDAGSVSVEQRQSYTIAYEPVSHLTIAVPHSLDGANQIEVLCDGQLLRPITVADDRASSAAPVVMRVALPHPRIGPCELVLRYSTAVTEPTPEHPSALALPLPMPAGGQLGANRLSVTSTNSICARPPKDGVWTVAPRTLDGPPELRLTAAKRAYRADLGLYFDADNASGRTIVSRAWVQSWLTPVARQDRATYQLTSNRKEIEVVLPAGAATDEANVMVDGQHVDGRMIGEKRMLVRLPGHRPDRMWTIELQYHFPGPRPRGAMTLEFPHIGPDVWVRQMFWQLVLPGNEHLIASPDGFTGECVWDWQGFYWGRQPLLDQSQLEQWSGAVPRDSLPERDNVYLFSTLGDLHQAEIHTASRAWIVLWASGARACGRADVDLRPGKSASGGAVGVERRAAGRRADCSRADVAFRSGGRARIGHDACSRIAGTRRNAPVASSRCEKGAAQRLGRGWFHVRGPPAVAGRRPPVDRDYAHHPVASSGEWRPMSAKAMLFSLLAVALLAAGRAPAADDDVSQTINFRRILAPADRIKDWPLGDGKYLPIDAVEFEHLVADTQPRTAAVATAPAVSIASAHYEAKLVDEHLAGRASVDVVLAGANPGSLPWEPCNLALDKIAWDTAPESPSRSTLLGLDADGKLALLVDHPGRLRFEWSLVGRRDAAEILTFLFEVPDSAASQLSLELPNRMVPSVGGGLVIGSEPGSKTTNRWHIELGGRRRVRVRILSADAAAAPPQLALLQEARTYDFTLRGLELSASWKIQSHNRPLQQVSATLDPGLRIVSARCGDESVPWTAMPVAGEQATRVMLTLPEPIGDAERVLRVTAIGPLIVDRAWRLPRIRPDGLSWQEGRITLLTPEPFTVERIVPLGCTQTQTGPLSPPRTGESLQFQASDPDATIDLSLSRRPAGLQTLSATAVELGSDEATARVAADLRFTEGRRFSIEADVAPHWVVHAIESIPPQSVVDWTVEPRPTGGQRLTVTLGSLRSTAARLRLVITAQRELSLPTPSLAADDLPPLRFREASESRRLVAVRPVGPNTLKLSGAERLKRLRSNESHADRIGPVPRAAARFVVRVRWASRCATSIAGRREARHARAAGPALARVPLYGGAAGTLIAKWGLQGQPGIAVPERWRDLPRSDLRPALSGCGPA